MCQGMVEIVQAEGARLKGMYVILLKHLNQKVAY